MSYPLRLPPDLDSAARERAGRIGISFNAFICVCVDAYLHGGHREQPAPAKRSKRASPASGDAAPAGKPEEPTGPDDWKWFNEPDSWPWCDPDPEWQRWLEKHVDPGEDDPHVLDATAREYWRTRERPNW